MRVLGASIMYPQTGLSYMKEVQASNGQVQISSPPGAVGRSGPAQAARSPDAPARASSYAPWWRGSRLDRPSSRGRSRLFQARSSPDSPASVQAQWQRCADGVTHPPTDATVPRAPRLPSWPGGTVLRHSTDHGTRTQSGPCSRGVDPYTAPAVRAGYSPVGDATPHPHASARLASCRFRRSQSPRSSTNVRGQASCLFVAPGCCARCVWLAPVDPACLTPPWLCATPPPCRVSGPPVVPGSRPPPACGPDCRPSPARAPRVLRSACQSATSSHLAGPPSAAPVPQPHVPAVTRSGCSSRPRPGPVPSEDSNFRHPVPASAALGGGPPPSPATGLAGSSPPLI